MKFEYHLNALAFCVGVSFAALLGLAKLYPRDLDRYYQAGVSHGIRLGRVAKYELQTQSDLWSYGNGQNVADETPREGPAEA